MSIELKVPELPESVAEATVGQWHKNAGDHVDRDENVVDLETDKVMLEVPATGAGVLKEVKFEAGATVTAGDVLAVLEEGEGGGPSGGGEDKNKANDKAAGRSGDGRDRTTASDGDTDKREPAQPSPAARKLMDEHELTAGRVSGSGKDGRITKADVLQAIEDADGQGAPEQGAATGAREQQEESERKSEQKSVAAALERADRAAVSGGGERLEQRVPMTRIRARIAERLLEVSQQTAMLTTFNEVDMHAVKLIRERYREKFEKDHDIRLGFMSFFVKAAIEALKRFPIVNATIDGDDVIYHGYYDIGIAVSAPRGLLVPVLRDADQLSFAGIEAQIRALGQRAQNGKITMDELAGGTFTITNGGVYGSMQSTPILNPPQSAILGMHAIKERPTVVDGEIAIRPIMMLAVSYDHRLIDGRDAVLFLRTIKELLEDPARLLLQI